MNKFMKVALNEARYGMERGEGGPFGAVIVKNGRIIASAHNEVLKTNDPTSHAEIVAIRKASKLLKRFDLSDCEIYSTCKPCPMCYGAIHWAKIPKLFFGCTSQDAAEIDFDDQFIYDSILGKVVKKRLKETSMDREFCLPLFKEWKEMDKIQY